MARLAQSTTPFWRESLRDGPQQIPPVTFRPRQVLVLMQMTSGDSDAVYRAIKAGCHTIDLVATRVDEKPGATVVMRDIDVMMGHAEFLVFDLSNERPNVYYELGYAHGIGNHAYNILLIAREDTRIHFDVAPLRVHFYRSLEHLEALVAAQLGELKRTTQPSALKAHPRKRKPRTMLFILLALMILGLPLWVIYKSVWIKEDAPPANGKEASALQPTSHPGDQAKTPTDDVNKSPREVQAQGNTSGASKATANTTFIGDILFTDGNEVRTCKISDHNPGPIGSGWDEASVGYSNNIDAALNHSTNRSRKLQYSRIRRIDILPLNAAEKETVARMDFYDRDKLLKCDITFHDGGRMNGIFLLPHYLRYVCTNETGNVLRDTTKSIILHQTK